MVKWSPPIYFLPFQGHRGWSYSQLSLYCGGSWNTQRKPMQVQGSAAVITPCQPKFINWILLFNTNIHELNVLWLNFNKTGVENKTGGGSRRHSDYQLFLTVKPNSQGQRPDCLHCGISEAPEGAGQEPTAKCSRNERNPEWDCRSCSSRLELN